MKKLFSLFQWFLNRKDEIITNVIVGLIIALIFPVFISAFNSFGPILIIFTIFLIGLAWFYQRVLKRQSIDLYKIRKKEINELIGYIQQGKSCSLVGVFGSEKTLILDYIRDEQNKEKLFGTQSNTLIFSKLDISRLKNYSQSQFWEEALIPVKDKIKNNSGFDNTYQQCYENDFQDHYLEKLIVQIKQANRQWVLMLDRFQMILYCPNLYCPSFLGTLRTKMDLSHDFSSFSLVISINQSLPKFISQYTNFFNPGSSYLNVIGNQTTLGALPERDIDQLLKQGKYHFSREDIKFIKDCAGEHPYLLQQAISILETEYKQQKRNYFSFIFHFSQKQTPIKKAQKIFEEHLLFNLLQSWSSNICEAFISVVRNENTSRWTGEL